MNLDKGDAKPSTEQCLFKVKTWLQKVLGIVDLPDFPTNNRCVEYLYRLMQQSQTADKQLQLLIQDSEHKAEEYAVTGDRLRLLLQRLSLNPTSFSTSGQENVQKLAEVGAQLKVASPAHAHYVLAASAVSEEEYDLSAQSSALQRSSRLLQRDTQTAVLRAARLDKAFTELSGVVAQEDQTRTRQEKETKFYGVKASEYLRQINRLQDQLTSQSYCESLDHGTLQRKAECLESTLERLRPIKSQLESYHSLPPDKVLTRVRVEELKKELAELQSQLEQQVDLVHM